MHILTIILFFFIFLNPGIQVFRLGGGFLNARLGLVEIFLCGYVRLVQ